VSETKIKEFRMFGFISMMGNYEERKVARYEVDDSPLVIDTCAVTDSSLPYETGIRDPRYNGGAWVIVELYATRQEAEEGHERWVRIMTQEPPAVLRDVSTAEIAELCDACGDDWRERPQDPEEKSEKV
jgi:hypothetical protein